MSLTRLVKTIVVIIALGTVVFVMINGIGLVDSLDFGAGAYYYADIPGFDEFGTTAADFSDTAVPVVIFFLVWCVFIIGLLALVKRIPKPSENPSEEMDQ